MGVIAVISGSLIGAIEVWGQTPQYFVTELSSETYCHLRREHSIAQAQKVSFAAAVSKDADVIPFTAMV